MNTERQTARELVERIKDDEAQVIVSAERPAEYARLHHEHEVDVGASGVNPGEFFEEYFTRWLEKIAGLLPEPAQSAILQRLAIGCMEHMTVNAFITRSDDGECFAIVMNRALLTMINHYVKLEAAAIYPESVTYLEDLPLSMMSPDLYFLRRSKILKDYAETGLPYGVGLKFGLKSEALQFVDRTLRLLHLFVLAHELGHYLNGDLMVEANFAPGGRARRLSFGGQNVSHDLEFKADAVAFDLVLRVMNETQPALPARRALELSAVLLFNFLREISNKGSESHPRPGDRLIAITREFFGDEAAALMARTFDDTSAIREFQRKFGKQTVAELLDRRRSSMTSLT